MKVGVFGSGFGLYGYLPALVRLGQTVVLPERYRETMESRDDVRRFIHEVTWEATEPDVLSRCDAVVISRRPADQVRLVSRGLAHLGISRYLLEKPLAPSPAEARDLLGQMRGAAKTVRVGFNFRHTAWAMRLRLWLEDAPRSARLSFAWRFGAHHYRTGRQTWKRRPSEGGGVVRFYAIHLIALLAEFGYRDVEFSVVRAEEADDARAWEAQFVGPGLPVCEVVVDSDADVTHFIVASGGTAANFDVFLSDPFDEAETVASGSDRRIEALTRLCREFLAAPPGIPGWYESSVDLWATVEAKSDRS